MLDVPITIMDIDHSHSIGPARSSQPSAAGNEGTATAPANPAPAGEVPSVTSTADGDEVEPAHDPNNASRAEGNIAELNHAPSIQQPPGRPIMVNSPAIAQEIWFSGLNQNWRHTIPKIHLRKSSSMKI